MWIVPRNTRMFCLYAPAMAESKSVFKECLEKSEFSLMWRSKSSRLRTWLIRWNREKWIQHLSGRILKHSDRESFEAALTSSLQVIRASRSVQPENKGEQKTIVTSGRMSEKQFLDADQTRFFLKMWRDILTSGSKKSSKIWKEWVIELRSEYSARLKSAHRIVEKGCLSWGTSRVTTNGGCPSPQCTGKGSRLEDQVALWPTPDQAEANSPGPNSQKSLTSMLKNMKMFPTPNARDHKGADLKSRNGGASLSHFLETGERIHGQQDQENASMIGKNREHWATPTQTDSKRGYETNEARLNRGAHTGTTLNDQARGKLNPDWVEQLMGLPVGWTQLSSKTDQNANRVDRLMLLGNGVVPQTAEKAYIVLFEKLKL